MSDKQLAATILEALKQRDAQKQAGALPAELAANLEQTLRASWPVTRAWHYLCERCRDKGWEYFDCPGDRTCGRAHDHGAHEYVRPCTCAAGVERSVTDRPASSRYAAGKKAPRVPTRWTGSE